MIKIEQAESIGIITKDLKNNRVKATMVNPHRDTGKKLSVTITNHWNEYYEKVHDLAMKILHTTHENNLCMDVRHTGLDTDCQHEVTRTDVPNGYIYTMKGYQSNE